MRVKELKLHNFRGIKDLHLVFNTEHNVVVLVGINGVGKSSILDCINVLVKYYFRTYNTNDPPSLKTDNNSRIQAINLSLTPGDNSWLYKSDIHIDQDRTINKILFCTEGNELSWEIAKSANDNDENYLKEIYQNSRNNIISNAKINFLNCYLYYLPNRRVIDPEKFSYDVSMFVSPLSEGELKDKGENIISLKYFSIWFKEIEDLENERRLSGNIEYRHPILVAVRTAIYSLLGSAEGYDNLTFKRSINQITIKKFDREIAVQLLSDGEKSLLAMVGYLARKLAEGCDSLDNPLEASALVLIDEIELHLHPGWQQMIIPRLTQTFPNCQFIVTTHSPQVLSHVNPECIHILDYDGDNVVVKRPDSSYGLDSNRILEDILGVSKRPKEIQERMSELFRNINNNDLESAKEIVRELGDKIGTSEPELIKAEATIKRREIIGR